MTLHITNGDSVVDLMRQAGIGGRVLPWRDLLHEGPVPADLSLSELSARRASFIASCAWGEEEEVLADFRKRDDLLGRYADFDEVLLWFEHDLYDQLQLLQLLDFFHSQDETVCPLRQIVVGEFLGMMSPAKLMSLLGSAEDVRPEHLQAAARAWAAFRAPEPDNLLALLQEDLAILPFLRPALRRHLEQFPDRRSGLARTERHALEALAQGHDTAPAIFRFAQDAEESPFMGDWTFWLYLKRLGSGDQALLQRTDGEALVIPPHHPDNEAFLSTTLTLSPAGRKVLAGELDWLSLAGIDTWLGGVHLRPGAVWRWDADSETLVQSDAR